MGELIATRMVIALSLLFLGWYGIGYWWNLRLKSRYLRSIAEKLGEYADKTEYISLGSTGFILRLRESGLKLQISLFLGKREIPIAWIIDWLVGRTDRLELSAEKKATNHCTSTLCFNLSSYWGSIAYKKSIKKAEKAKRGWHCRSRSSTLSLEGLEKYLFFISIRSSGSRCIYRVSSHPVVAGEVTELVVS